MGNDEKPMLIRKCQLIQLRLLKIFKKVCEQKKWKYWLDGGTLLGAVRHRGFIPWDDDADVVMPREDYEALKQEGGRLFPEEVFFQTHETDAFPLRQVIKLRDKYSTIIESMRLQPKVKYHQGIYIDIMPIDRIKRKSARKMKYIAAYLNMMQIYGERGNRPLRRFFKRFLILIREKVIGFDRLFRIYQWNWVDGAKEDYVYFQLFKGWVFPQLILEERDLYPLGEMLFENESFPVPANPDKYLRLMYGDYMKLPPPEQRHPHNERILPFTPCDHKEVLQWRK